MVRTHNLGFPRIGANRELKFALESFWRGESTEADLIATGETLRRANWQRQAQCDLVPVGDFSFYDHVLDTSALLGNLPQRASAQGGSPLDQYFRVARGRSANEPEGVRAGEMTKWFDTNYHYIVPELHEGTEFQLNADPLIAQLADARAQAVNAKPVVLGPLSYLWLGKGLAQPQRLDLLDRLLPVYLQLFEQLTEQGVQWLQIDEPILVCELPPSWQQAFERAYHTLQKGRLKLLLTSYFGELQDNLLLACKLPVAGLHLDAVNARSEVARVLDWLPEHKVLSLGVINGRNIWKTDLNATLDWLEPIAKRLGERLWLAPSCSLLHVPVDLQAEQQLDPEIKHWLAFAVQKLDELAVLGRALNSGRAAVAEALAANAAAIASRKQSSRVHKPAVQAAVAALAPALGQRRSPYPVRAAKQRQVLRLPAFPTTTIGSFPQTAEIRASRQLFKRGELDASQYTAQMQAHIADCIARQEALGLDVLVHGEAERNDMVEYFGEQLQGYAFSQCGWVQSYGSRCVKPPILYGDIQRGPAMTVAWTRYAQSLSDKPVKGMLTGPVTLLNWSFVRDDQSRSDTCRQLALAIREEVLDLEKAGVRIIQIDEAALREGLPLRPAQWQSYLDWAVEAFRLCAGGVDDSTQIHTHMCYSDFNNIIDAIAAMDADVITIETSRSDMALLDVFEHFSYPNEIGPGVYDIHSPNIPSAAQMVDLMRRAAERIAPQRLWVNPDCGLKTRQWHEVLPALENMVKAAHTLRAAFPALGETQRAEACAAR